jgi:hypothetical protein
MTESQKADLEQKYMLVESDYFNNVIYAIDRKGKGIYVINGDKTTPIAANQVHTFAAELVAVWDTLRPRTVLG